MSYGYFLNFEASMYSISYCVCGMLSLICATWLLAKLCHRLSGKRVANPSGNFGRNVNLFGLLGRDSVCIDDSLIGRLKLDYCTFSILFVPLHYVHSSPLHLCNRTSSGTTFCQHAHRIECKWAVQPGPPAIALDTWRCVCIFSPSQLQIARSRSIRFFQTAVCTIAKEFRSNKKLMSSWCQVPKLHRSDLALVLFIIS